MDKEENVEKVKEDSVSPIQWKVYCSKCKSIENGCCTNPLMGKVAVNECFEPNEEFIEKCKAIDKKIDKEFPEEISEKKSKKLSLHIGWRSYESMKEEQDLIFEDLFERFKRGIIKPAFKSFIQKNNETLKSIMKIFYYSLISGAYE